MTFEVRMTAEGTKQGKIRGTSLKVGNWNTIGCYWLECRDFNFAVTAPITHSTGTPKGKRPHNPIVIKKEVDGSSPQLFQALCTNEVLRTVKIKFSRIEGEQPRKWNTVELTNAVVSKITCTSNPPGVKGPCEQLEVSYEKIASGVRSKKGEVPPLDPP